jgi:hypothetical protein
MKSINKNRSIQLSLVALLLSSLPTFANPVQINFSTLLTESTWQCKVTVFEPIKYYDSGELRLDIDWQDYVTKDLGWDSYFPYTAVDGACFGKGNNTVLSIYEGNSLPEVSTGYYFFQIKVSDTGYDISWNGSRGYSHAQWHVTEKADFLLKTDEVCFSHPAIEMCFSKSNLQ